MWARHVREKRSDADVVDVTTIERGKTENERKAFVTPMIWLRNRFSIWFDCFSYKWDHFESWFCQWIPHSTFRWSIFVVWCAYTDIAISCNKALNLCRPIPVGSRWGWRWGWEIEGECSVMALIKTYLVIGLMDLKGSKVLTTYFRKIKRCRCWPHVKSAYN